MHQLEKTHLFRLLDLIGMNVSENLIVIAYDAMLSALIKKISINFLLLSLITSYCNHNSCEPLPESGNIRRARNRSIPVALP